MSLDPVGLLEELLALPGPPGQEDAVRDFLKTRLDALQIPHRTDARGNLLVGSEKPSIVVTAHLDEIALIITGFTGEGEACVAPLGGVKPFKWGESVVEILSTDGTKIPGVLSFGGIHTEATGANISKDSAGHALTFDDARVRFFQGEPEIGDRVVLGPDRRKLTRLGNHKIAGPFLDDRADLVSWLLAIANFPPLLGARGQKQEAGGRVLFVASVSEETGGEGALWVLGQHRPEVCIALELAPIVPDAPILLSPEPVLWIKDGFATLSAAQIHRVRRARPTIQSAVLSRGGSDASIGQSMGLCAHGITLGFPCENSHGLEIMDERALKTLTDTLLSLIE